MITMDNVDMREYTSYKAGGRAKKMVIPDSREELCSCLKSLRKEKKKYLLLGNGSNFLVRDGGYSGTVVKLGTGFSDIQAEKKGERLHCGASALLSQAARSAMEFSMTGLEFASGIPGSIGGAVFMNAGAYGGEMKDVIESVEVLDPVSGEFSEIACGDMDFGYRKSRIQKTGEVVIGVTFSLKRGKKEAIAEVMRDLNERRKQKQPLMYPSCGSFFKRPEGYFAGKLIQDAGLKGLSVGGAQVSEKHAGFIVNRGGATAEDIIRLMRLVQNTVMDKYGVKLEPEVRIIGD